MVYEFRELTDIEAKTLADYGQRIMAFGVSKANVQTERATYEIGFYSKTNSINTEITKLTDATTAIRSASTLDNKVFTFRELTDAEAKTISDNNQKIAALKNEIVKLNADRAAREVVWQGKVASITAEMVKLSEFISTMREAVEK
jgi:uncharacterized small protein (DUF1192 family)